jgi:hypothetical protein
MTDDLSGTLLKIRTSAAEFDGDGVEDGIEQLEWFTEDDGTWGAELFHAITDLLKDEAFVAAGKSFRLVRLLQLDWDDLSAHQHLELRPLLTAAFDKFGDWLGSQLVAELLAQHFPDAAAFEALDTLSRQGATRPARALAAYGIGRLARALERGALYERAVEALRVLAASTEAEVVEEARDALRILKSRESSPRE